MTDMTMAPPRAEATAFRVLIAISFCHMLNDTMQSLLAAIYPILKVQFSLDYWQIGSLTAAFMVTASILQPLIGFLNDRRPRPKSLPFAMVATTCGVLLLAFGPGYPFLLAGAALIGIGSSIFHPEAIRVSRAASGGRHGLAQSIFNTGGNAGTSLGPLLAAFIVVPFGRPAVALFAALAVTASAVLAWVSRWHVRSASRARPEGPGLSRGQVAFAIGILLVLIFSRFIYIESLNSYYTFYLIQNFGLTTQQAQLMLFLFLVSLAVGIFLGGPLGDRIGARRVIWASILGPLPLTLLLPHVGLAATGVLTVLIGLAMASAFPAIIVFSQELMPGRVGLVAGLFYGFAFGVAGIGAAALGMVADAKGLDFVYQICAVLPALGILAAFLPKIGGR